MRDEGTCYEGSYQPKSQKGSKVSYSRKDLKSLHKHLYSMPGSQNRSNCNDGLGNHPNDVFYVIVCRAILGHHVVTRDGKRQADSTDLVFSMDGSNKSELANMPFGDPPQPYHSLVADICPHLSSSGIQACQCCLKRFREFVIFHGENIYPEFLLAYQRPRSAQ